jgi:hypothetical protein
VHARVRDSVGRGKCGVGVGGMYGCGMRASLQIRTHLGQLDLGCDQLVWFHCIWELPVCCVGVPHQAS